MELCGMNNHYRFYDLEYCFKSLSSLGFKNIEVWTGPMHFYVDYNKNEDVQKLIDLSKKYDLNIIGICPEQTNPKPNNVATKERIEDVLAYYKRIIDISSRVGGKTVTVTSGWAYLNETKEEAWNRSIQMMQKIADMAKEKKIDLVMEALQPDESILVNSSLDLAKYIKDVNRDNLFVCIDFGAMARANETIDDYFNNLPGLIKHVHFVDGKPTGHLAWGDGTRSIKQDIDDLKKHGYDGYLSCESVSGRYYMNPIEADEKNMKSFREIEVK